METTWTLRLLDNFQLAGPRGDAPFSARKATALLAYLAVQPTRTARREVLANLLWENVDYAQARVSLRQALAAIRKIEGDNPPLVIADADFLKLSPDVLTDVAEFERLSGGDEESRRQAVALYRTDLMAGFGLRDGPAFNEWLAIEQARLRQQAVSLLSGLIDAAVAEGGDLNLGASAALRLLALDPFNEAAHRGLMTIYARQGRAALALSQYRSLSELLRRELQVAPEARTQQLYETLRAARRRDPEPAGPRHEPVSAAPSAETIPPSDLSQPDDDEVWCPLEPAADMPAALPAPAPRRRTLAWIAGGGLGLLLLSVALVGGWLAMRAQPGPPVVARLFPIADSPALETQPALSPNGEQVVYVMADGGNADLYLSSANVDGAPLRLTQDGGVDQYPAWRPDGLAIAFSRSTPKGDTPCEIIVRPVPVGDERVVGRCKAASDAALSWTPDGKGLVFVDSPNVGAGVQLYRLDLESGAVSTLTHPSNQIIGDVKPSVSHDGRRVAFLRMTALYSTDLMVLDLKTGKTRTLIQDGKRIWSVVWNKDDRGLIFSSTRAGDSGLWWIDAEGRQPPHRLSAGLLDYRLLSYSAVRNRLAFEASRARSSLYELPPGATPATAPMPVANLRNGLFDQFPSQARDGDILFVSERSGSPELWTAAPGQAPRQITRSQGWLYQTPAWSPDGRRIAFIGVRAGRSDLYLIDKAGGARRRLTDDLAEDATPAWSPDGRYLYLSSRRDGAWRIWRLDPDAPADARPVSPVGVWLAKPSPDGKSLYYVLDGLAGIRRRPIGPDGVMTGQETMVTPDLHPYDWRNWFVTDTAVVYARREGAGTEGSIRRLDLATGQSRDIADAQALSWSSSFAPRNDGGLLLAKRELQIDISGIDFN